MIGITVNELGLRIRVPSTARLRRWLVHRGKGRALLFLALV